MAGHSQFKNIMYRKGAQDAKRAKAFTKIIRELTVAARAGGADPQSNPRLRAAIMAAREANMPKDTMDRAIKRGTGEEESVDYQEIRYEGYGPGGVAILVEALTDNRNRTASDVRSTFTKYGGNLGETNSVAFMFDHIGLIRYPASVATGDAMFEIALDVGAENVESSTAAHEIECKADDLTPIRDALTIKFGDPLMAQLTWRPKTLVAIDGENAESLLKLISTLEDNDDVQTVASNYDISEEVLNQMKF